MRSLKLFEFLDVFRSKNKYGSKFLECENLDPYFLTIEG
jgi:hypothetical protein